LSDEQFSRLDEKVAGWIGSARWFSGKGSAAPRVSIDELAILPDGRQGLALVDSQSGGAGGAPETIRSVVPLDLATGLDCTVTPEFAGALVRLTLSGGELHGQQGWFVGRPVGDDRLLGEAGRRWGQVTVAPLGGDASNTSLRIDSVAPAGPSIALKLLRRCRPGINPEVECGQFFAEATDWEETPRLLGWVEYRPFEAATPADHVAIATLHAFEPGCRSAWDHCLALVAEGGLDGHSLRDFARRLGATTARMHSALACRHDLPAFAPRPATAESRRALAAACATHARGILARAFAAAPQSPVSSRLEALARSSGRIVAALESVAQAGTTAADIRLHGDYHLGQVLVDSTGTRLLPIDFEGEPGRSLEERRAPQSACKDVAGMCRSFDYLARVAGRGSIQAAASRDGSPGADAAKPVESFLAAYREKARGAAWWPADAIEEKRLLDAFLLDKACYELGYELSNRPDWIDVPLGALEQWLAGPA
jgi:maltose alpha-D-glucosyltransferase/alpha-amylase